MDITLNHIPLIECPVRASSANTFITSSPFHKNGTDSLGELASVTFTTTSNTTNYNRDSCWPCTSWFSWRSISSDWLQAGVMFLSSNEHAICAFLQFKQNSTTAGLPPRACKESLEAQNTEIWPKIDQQNSPNIIEKQIKTKR